MEKMTIRDIDVTGKRVLVRVDFNVPLDKRKRVILDDSRIQAALPTIKYLTERSVKVILISHLGRPKGKVVDRLRLNIVAQRLSQILGQQVGVATDCIGPEVENSVASLQGGDVLLLENLRFHSTEETGSASFAQALARLADVFVNDAFGTSHRAHTSIMEITNYIPAVAGLLLEKEIENLGHILTNPTRPFCALLGGAKVSDKVGMIENIMNKVDYLLIGGGMAATFLKDKSLEVGHSLIEDDMVDTALRIISNASRNDVNLILPVDVVIVDNINPKAKGEIALVDSIPKDKTIVDIGPQTIREFRKVLRNCKTIFWNGPMGVCEIKRFAKGTRSIAKLLAGLSSTSVIGGGSTAEVVVEMNLTDKMTFISTGGGASLKFLGGEKLPGVESLLDIRMSLEQEQEVIKNVARSTSSKIVLIVIDGLGGLPHPDTGKTELETAKTPNLDQLASKSICGLTDPVSPGITPGSAPSHLAIFGYNPITYNVGRGVLETMGINFDLQLGDIAARGNFCTVDNSGLIVDRRAGRISTDRCAELCQLLDGTRLDGVDFIVKPVKDHRFIVVLRGENLIADLGDSDPQMAMIKPMTVSALRPQAGRTANITNQFVNLAKEILSSHHPANMLLLRGFSKLPSFPTMTEIYKLNPAAIAGYPMYRGLAKLVGMKIIETGSDIKEEIITLEKHYYNNDFFYLHVKDTDSAGEDGDFKSKVKALEEFDLFLPKIINLKPDVIVITGDHSTPALLKGHSWHTVPILLHAKWCRTDAVNQFSESTCVLGALGRFPATQIMPLALANALKLVKFGA